MLGFRNEESAYTSVELRRGKRRLASKGPTHMRSGQSTLELAIAEHIAAGDAILDIGFKDAEGHDRAITRAIKIPHLEQRRR